MRWIISALAVACDRVHDRTGARARGDTHTHRNGHLHAHATGPRSLSTRALNATRRYGRRWRRRRPGPSLRRSTYSCLGYEKFWPRWEYGPDRAWMVSPTTRNRLVLDCATGEPELHIEITGDPLPGDGQDSIEIVWSVRGGPRDGTPDTWARSADGRTLHPSGVFKLHVLADASWAAVDLPGADEVFWFVGPYTTIDTSRLSCVP